MTIDDEDREVWEAVLNVSRVNKVAAVITLILNLLVPGLGTGFAAWMDEAEIVSKTQLCCGFLQLLTAPVLVGYIFALTWSVLICKKAFTNREQSPIPLSSLRQPS